MSENIKMHNVDFDELIKAIDSCKGNIYLETADGDSLNLKSKLSQMLGLSNVLNGAQVTEAKLRCEDPEDETVLFRFDLYGELPEK